PAHQDRRRASPRRPPCVSSVRWFRPRVSGAARVSPAQAALLLLAAFAAGPALSAGGRQAPEPFPLRPGTYWIYRGTVKWTPSGSAETRQEAVTWKMEVLRSLRTGP